MDLDENHYTYTFWVYLHLQGAVFWNIEKKMVFECFFGKKLWRYDLHEIATAITRELYKI